LDQSIPVGDDYGVVYWPLTSRCPVGGETKAIPVRDLVPSEGIGTRLSTGRARCAVEATRAGFAAEARRWKGGGVQGGDLGEDPRGR
jgi:hypothetical protein